MPREILYVDLEKRKDWKWKKKCKLPFKKLGDEQIKPKGSRTLELIKMETKISEKEGKHKIEKIQKTPFECGSLKIDKQQAILIKKIEKMNLTIPRMKTEASL